MNETYKAYFGLTKTPFASNLALNDVLVTPEIESFFGRLRYALDLGLAAVIKGEVGSRKSTTVP